MSKFTEKSAYYSLILVVLCLLFIPFFASAAPELVPVEGAQYNVNTALNANLKALTGKNVEISMSSGQKIQGTIKVVGEQLLHIEKIQGKEFNDALIKIDNIVAVETKFREYKH